MSSPASSPYAAANPFAPTQSGYGRVVRGTFVSSYDEASPLHRLHRDSHDVFKAFVSKESFPCVAGRTVARTDEYAFCAYPSMTDPAVAEGVMHDMLRFQHEFGIPMVNRRGRLFRSFVAAFPQTEFSGPLEGARGLYELLGNMHQINAAHFEWKEGFSADTDSADFGYSSGESAFFIASFHSNAHDVERRAPLTFVVFNSHVMLQALRANGKFAQLRDLIRSRQETVHPYLGDHGDTLEWRQYALLSPDPETEVAERQLRHDTLGLCPFHPSETGSLS